MTNLEARHFAHAVLRQNSGSESGRARAQRFHPAQSASDFLLRQGLDVRKTMRDVLPTHHHHKLYFLLVPGLQSKHSGSFSRQPHLSRGRSVCSHPADSQHGFQVANTIVQVGSSHLHKSIHEQ